MFGAEADEGDLPAGHARVEELEESPGDTLDRSDPTPRLDDERSTNHPCARSDPAKQVACPLRMHSGVGVRDEDPLARCCVYPMGNATRLCLEAVVHQLGTVARDDVRMRRGGLVDQPARVVRRVVVHQDDLEQAARVVEREQ